MDGALNLVNNLVDGLANGTLSAYAAVSALAWGLIATIRGGAGFKIPWVTDRINALSKGETRAVLLGLGAVAGAASGVGLGGLAVGVAVKGALAGVATVLTADGVNSAANLRKPTVWAKPVVAPTPPGGPV